MTGIGFFDMDTSTWLQDAAPGASIGPRNCWFLRWMPLLACTMTAMSGELKQRAQNPKLCGDCPKGAWLLRAKAQARRQSACPNSPLGEKFKAILAPAFCRPLGHTEPF